MLRIGENEGARLSEGEWGTQEIIDNYSVYLIV